MGRFVETNEITWPVKVKLPVKNKVNKFTFEKFNVTFHVMNPDERDAHMADVMLGKDPSVEDVTEARRKGLEIVVSNISGWDLEDMEFTDDNLERVMNNHFYREAIMKAHIEAQNGGEAKN
jgi:putative N-acetylmannosamine-6-phosphate epimerase